MDPVTTRADDDGTSASAGGEALLADLLERLLGRPPRPRELSNWVERLGRIRNAENFLRVLLQWKALDQAHKVPTHAPIGHLHSPIVDPGIVGAYVEENRAAAQRAVAGVPLELEAMDAFWERSRAAIAATPFTGGAAEEPAADGAGAAARYAFGATAYVEGDAVVLRALLAERRPARAIEIGPGVATPCLMDCAGELGLDLAITVIDPAAGRLAALARPGDRARLELVGETLQGQPLERFATLAAGDLLLIDSSHVLKTGSDLHYLLFYVLPVLAPGVLVQFHDCRFPFEYSNGQIFEKNCSWNEVYAVRALLMYSTRFKALFSASWWAARREGVARETFAPFLNNPGSALWVEVQDDGAPTGLDAVGGLTGFTSCISADPGASRPGPGGKPAAVRIAAQGRQNKAGRPLVKAEVAAENRTIAFDVVDGTDGPAFFGLGVRKSGSTMFHKILTFLAKANGINDVNVPGTFFRHGLSVAAWARQDLSAMVRPGNIYTGFRSFPVRLAASDPYRGARKVFMHRDPRDAIVSQYFSDAFSHMLPDQSSQNEREKFLEKRESARATDIDTWVVDNAPSLAKTLEAFAPVLSDPSCLVFPYEAYVFEKRDLIDKVLAHFTWRAGEEEIAALLSEIDVRPKSEDPTRFVRKATPGDHVNKLRPATVAELDAIFGTALGTFGYR